MSREKISNDKIIQWYTLKMAMFISFKSFNLPYGTSDAHTGKDPVITTGFIPLASDVGQSSLIYQAVKF